MVNEKSSPGDGGAVLSSLSALFALIGGVGTVAVAIGYLNRYSYFRVLGASWLTREAPISEIAWDSVPIAAVFVFMVMYFRAVRMRASYRLGIITALILAVGGIGLNVYLLNAENAFIRIHWAVTASLGITMLTVGAALLMLIAVDALQENSSSSRARALTLASWFAITGLVITPIFVGAISGRQHMLHPEQEFDCVVVVNSPSCMPAIYLASQRVYCLGRLLPNGKREILVFKWEDVLSVHPSSR